MTWKDGWPLIGQGSDGDGFGLFAQAPSGTPSNTATRIGWTDFDGFWVSP